ncbi:MAG: PilZ domain-containing protein [Nitrospirae bacterium]|nr:PilZ domain-containing protein [Nitrospirota bacterium]
MGLFSWLGGSKVEAPPGSLVNPKEVDFVLKNASTENVKIEVSFTGDQMEYVSKFLEAGKAKSGPYLAIAPLDPEDGNTVLTRRKVFEVHFQYRDIPYGFRANLVASLEGGCYKITSPPFLLRTQKRSYFRVFPSYQDPVFVSFMVSGNTYKEKVEDLSEGGFSFSTNLEKDILKPGLVMENTVLYLPDDTVFTNCVLRAHFPNKDSTATKYKCGVQFQRLEGNDAQVLARYIFKRQRDMLQEDRAAQKKE